MKTCHYVKEYGEGVDRMYRELEVNGAAPLSFHTDDFILKVSVPRVAELTENRIAILRLIAENPYISQSELAESIGISVTAIGNNIKTMRNKYICRVGADKGGFWEIIE